MIHLVKESSDTATQPSFPVVGVGASAGGLEAFVELVRHLPPQPGLAFILVFHLDPSHKSLLPEILGRETSMAVALATEGMTVERDHVYVIAPNTNLTIESGHLRLTPRSETVGPFMPIDHFFRSLARDQGSRAIAVVLSGGGTDGALGIEDVKGTDGITFVQAEKTAKQDAMPRSAIGTGSVDFILPPADIARELVRVGALVRENAERPQADQEENPEAFSTIFRLVRAATGTDFSQYKHGTISRRVRRRMALAGNERLEDYVALLGEQPGEVRALYQDFLIRVTSFFRDPQAFAALREKVFPALVRDRAPGSPIRIWVAGCATGEEVYSIAMLLLEYLGDISDNTPIKILASDVNEASLERARAGLYVDNIALDVSPERLQRFFVLVNGSYQISKAVRDLCVFSRHNLAKDTPFANLDLISCRNVLIYLDSGLQKRILPLFHYALKPTGALFLGTAESIGSFSDLFGEVDKECRIYVRKATATRAHIDFGNAPPRGANGRLAISAPVSSPDGGSGVEVQREAELVLLSHYVPPGLIIDEHMTILHFRGQVGAYLNPTSGAASLDVLKMVREGLAFELRAAVLRAKSENLPVRTEHVPLAETGFARSVTLEVVPLKAQPLQSQCFLVLFQETTSLAVPPDGGSDAAGADSDAVLRIARLERELATAREQLQSVVEENESTSEELKSANEEILSSNEELQSTNEELQSAKEEQQSANEELTTVNEELEHRNRELDYINDDLVNLLASLDIPVVMVSRELRIRRFTPPAETLFKLIPTDVGRPISDLHPKLKVPGLEGILSDVVRTLAAKELEVQDDSGRWHLLRVRPYVTGDNRIEGAALAVLDIDEMKTGSERLKSALDYADAIIEAVQQPLVVLDDDLRVKRANAAFFRTFSVTRGEVEGRPFEDIQDGRWDHAQLRARLRDGVPGRACVKDLEVRVNLPALGPRTMLVNGQRFDWAASGSPVTLLAIEDITDRKNEMEHEKLLAREQAARAQAESANRMKDEFLAMLAHELRNPLAPVRNTLTILRQRRTDDPVAVRALEMSERQVGHMARLLDDLLDVSRITRGKIALQKEFVNLNQLLTRSVESCRHALESRRHTLTVNLPSKPVFLEADPTRLEQVVCNLLNNAAKYTDPGGKVTLDAEQEGARVIIKVGDSGVGIAPEMISRVFDLFAQADRSLDRSQGGLGIGLTLVKRLVELHSGTVAVSSAGIGKGSEFAVVLPAVGEDLPQHIEAAESATGEQRPRRILVVDDNYDAADTLSVTLGMVGHDVRVAHDGPEALRIAAEYHPEVVVLDIGLPGMSGYDVAIKLRQDVGLVNAVLVAVTGYGQEEDRHRSRESGMSHHLVKPIDFADLERILSMPL